MSLDRRHFLLGLGWISTTDYLLCTNAILINQVNPKDVAGGIKLNAEYVITAQWPLDVDADVDLHVIVPDGHSGTDVYYNHKEYAGVTLDHDCRGFVDTHHRLIDGGNSVDLAAVEMTTLRGIVPGHYDVGVHLFKMKRDGNDVPDSTRGLGVRVHVELVKLNPRRAVVFAADVALDHVRQCINVCSFDLARSGDATMTPPPLEPVTRHAYSLGAAVP